MVCAYQNSFGPFHFGNLVRDSLARKEKGKKGRRGGRKRERKQGRKEKRKEERGKAHPEKETLYNDLKYRT